MYGFPCMPARFLAEIGSKNTLAAYSCRVPPFRKLMSKECMFLAPSIPV